jgi:hypothetical protein
MSAREHNSTTKRPRRACHGRRIKSTGDWVSRGRHSHSHDGDRRDWLIRPSSQWRTTPASPKQKRVEVYQIVLEIVTLAVVVAEWMTHRIVHNVP